MNYILLLVLMLPMLPAWAGQEHIANITDPVSDDHGSGTLRYPQRADFQVGDLDLLQMRIDRDAEGFWFEAKLKNTIRAPDQAATPTGESLADFARKGFYQFNIDIYVDTDHVPGSGNTFTLPGRQVRIAPDFAWERAVILTPRPELMRQQLLDALAEQYPERSNAEFEASIDQSLFFPTKIRVRGKSIAFFVPAGFFLGSDGKSWGITAFVTGAITTIPADLSLLPPTKKPLERLRLGVMQPVLGHPKDTLGYTSGDGIPGPVVDLLGTTAEQLAAHDELIGVYWGKTKDVPVSSDAQTVGVAVTVEANPVVPIGALLQPGNPAPKVIEATPVESPAIAKRLQALQQLFEQKLIDEADYKEQKQRILKEL